MSKHLMIVTLTAISFGGYTSSWVIPDLQSAFSEVQQFIHGDGKKHESEHFSNHGEKGEKGYDAHHEEEAGAKGHHDKEGHKGSYAEEGGNKKAQHHDDGYYSAHHKGDKGEKGHHFEEKGSYAQGHSTKGGHKVHKLDEFKKNTEFFDEDHDEAYKEKHGGFEEEYDSSSGSSNKGGHNKKIYFEGDFGKSGKAEEGSFYAEDNGHKKAAGNHEHYAEQEEFAKEGENDGYKKWGFEY